MLKDMKIACKIILVIISLFALYCPAHAQEYKLDTVNHIKYMDGHGNGSFEPEGYVTRGETAQIIYNLMTEKPETTKKCTDVSDGAWYSEAVNSLYSAGIMEGKYSDSTFFARDYVSRCELIETLYKFFPESHNADCNFDDVEKESRYYPALCYAYENGWIKGYDDNKFYPHNPLTRAELTAVLNRVLSRSADKEFISANDRIRIFTDVEPEHWAYYHITEATIEHTYIKDSYEKWQTYSWEKTGLESGYYMINHRLYYVEEDTGQFAVNCTRDGFAFDERGRYTTGNKELDGYLFDVVSKICTNVVKSEANLEAIYFYVRDNFNYQARQILQPGATGWETTYALPMMKSHWGNCYSWASVFMYLTRCAGFESVCQSGTTGKNNVKHGWTEIEFDGVWYIFDPEMEYSSRKSGNKNFYKRYYKLPYNNSIKSYTKY